MRLLLVTFVFVVLSTLAISYALMNGMRMTKSPGADGADGEVVVSTQRLGDPGSRPPAQVLWQLFKSAPDTEGRIRVLRAIARRPSPLVIRKLTGVARNHGDKAVRKEAERLLASCSTLISTTK